MPPYPIFAPASASFRCRNAFRYLVLSYVTRPTTINAITETPANTPNPIGSTSSFRPGVVAAASWAAAAEGVVMAVDTDPFDKVVNTVTGLDPVALEAGTAVAVFATWFVPITDTAGGAAPVTVAAAESVAEAVTAPVWVAGMVFTPIAEIGGTPVAAAAEVIAVLVSWD